MAVLRLEVSIYMYTVYITSSFKPLLLVEGWGGEGLGREGIDPSVEVTVNSKEERKLLKLLS